MNINTDSSIDITESFSINATENLKEYVVKRSFPVEYNGRKIEIKNIKVLEDSRDIIVKPFFTILPRLYLFLILLLF